MEPIVRDGKIREQIELEEKGRREYPAKWGFLANDEANEFYNLKKNNQKLKEYQQKEGKNVNMYEYTGHGESYFVSPQMFKALLETCRCGRKKTNTHAIKCMQRSKNHYEKSDEEDEDKVGNKSKSPDEKDSPKSHAIPKIPVRSSGWYGWPNNRYVSMERSTYYISPRYTMPGHKIDSQPYNNIILG